MMTIWKYELSVGLDTVTLRMPGGAVILSLQTQGAVPDERPTMWAIVDPGQPSEERHFAIVGTGNPFPAGIGKQDFIGTFQIFSNSLVFHVFEVHRAL
jgi:hypothetical protein